jgi:hypothetical protein
MRERMTRSSTMLNQIKRMTDISGIQAVLKAVSEHTCEAYTQATCRTNANAFRNHKSDALTMPRLLFCCS